MGNTDQTKTSQCDKILEHMRVRGPITAWAAAQSYGCLALHSRISDLRARGVSIQQKRIQGNGRTHWYEYSLAPEEGTPVEMGL